MHNFMDIITHAVMITAFVSVVMVVIEYLNVRTRGVWEAKLQSSTSGQYFLAAFLGIIPGCLGAFTVAAMYLHGSVTVGALVAAMIASCGDTAFFILALVPGWALLIIGVLLILGIISGFLTDRLINSYFQQAPAICEDFVVHQEVGCGSFSVAQVLHVWQNCTMLRVLLSITLLLFIILLAAGWIAPEEEVWIRLSVMGLLLTALFIVATVPDHFLKEHLWEHVLLKHLPPLIIWILAAIIIIHFFADHLELVGVEENSRWIVLVVACLIGLIPDSGPQLLFVTLFAKGLVPFSVLLANSIVQDGHGMLPILAHSRKSFCLIKLINFGVGLLLGVTLMLLGI